MALPVVSRNWQFLVNELAAGNATLATQSQALLLAIKNALLGQGSTWTNRAGGSIAPVGGATVMGSSNSVAAGMDGVDRWITGANIVNNGGNHSWIVLQMFSDLYVLLDCNVGGNGESISAFASHTPFTGGAINARPTSTTEVQLRSSQNWGASNGTNQSTRLHVMMSADGLAKRVFLCRAGFCVGQWLFETPGSPTAGWANPYYAFLHGGTGNAEAISTNDFCDATSALGRGYVASSAVMAAATLGFAASPLFSAVASLAKLYGVRLASATGGNQGDWGLLTDLWLGSTSRTTGSTYPATPSPTREFVHFGSRVVPWNGSIPLMAA